MKYNLFSNVYIIVFQLIIFSFEPTIDSNFGCMTWVDCTACMRYEVYFIAFQRDPSENYFL